MPRNILIDPQRTGSGNPNIQFSGSSGNTLRLEVLSEGSVQFTGVSGSLLKIADFPAAGGALNSLFLSGTTAVTGSILPGVSNLYDLGSSSKVWANVFATNISGSLTGSNLTAGQVVVAGTGGILSGTNVFTYDGNLTISGTLRSVYSAGDEGGEIFLTKPQTNTSINSGVTIDMYQNKIRIFESGGTNRGGYFDISSLGAGVATNLVAAGGSSTNYWFESAANTIYTTGSAGVGTTSYTARFYVSGSSTTSVPTALFKAGVGSPTGAIFDAQQSDGTSILYVSGSSSSNYVTAYGVSQTTPSNTNGIFRVLSSATNALVMGALTNSPFATYIQSGGGNQYPLSLNPLGGSVGIGITNPSSRFYVTGSSTTTETTAIIKSGVAVPTGNSYILDVQKSSGTSVLAVSGSGKVGIGVQPLISTLQVYSGSSVLPQISAEGSSGTAGVAGYNLRIDTTDLWQLITDNNAANGFYLQYNNSSTTGRYFTVTTTGNVGIGTTSPGAKFNSYSSSNGFVGMIAGASYGAKFTSAAGTGMQIAATDPSGVSTYSPLFLQGTNISIVANANVVGTPTIYADTNQNVGIGQTTTLTARLLVSGSSTASTPTVVVKEGVASPTGGAGTFDVQNSAGTSLLFVSGSGFIGFGTTTPAYRFDAYSQSRIISDTSPQLTLEAVSNSVDSAIILRSRDGSGSSLRSQITQSSSTGALTINNDVGGNGTARGLIIQTVGTERVRIDSSGNVGIGTTTTGDKLAVNGSMSVTGSLLPGTDNTYDLGSSTKRWRNLYAGNISGSLTGSNLTAGQVVVAGTGGVLSGSNDFFWDNTNKYVGIGTGSPAQALHVRGSTGSDVITLVKNEGAGRAVITLDSGGSSDSQVRFVSQGTNKWAILSSPTDLGFYNYSTTSYSMFIAGTTGNVGINTTTSTAKFTVSGSATTSTPTAVIREGVASPTGGVGTLDVQNSAGTSLLFVSGSGNVGIGSSTPAVKLDVAGAIRGTTLAADRFGLNASPLNTTSTTQSFLRFQNTGGDFYVGIESSTAGAFFPGSAAYSAALYNGAATPLHFFTSATLRATIDSSGNVGIGTTSPATKLDVYSGAVKANYGVFSGSLSAYASPTGALYAYWNSGIGTLISVSDNSGTAAPMQLRVGSTLSTHIDASGNVGIGTAVPTAKLTVAGDLYFDQARTIRANSVGEFLLTNPADAAQLTLNTGTSAGYITKINLYGGGATPANTVTFTVASAEQMRINSTGVGIGTTLMSDKLAVNGTVSVTGSYLNPGVDNSTSLGASNKRWSSIYGTNIYGNLLPTSMTPGSVLYINSSGAVAQDNSNLFWNDSSKSLGIGTASPGTKLSVYGGAVSANYGVFSGSLSAFASSTGALYTYYSGTTAVISANSDNSGNVADLDVFTGMTRAMRINTSQNVGIGTVTYTARLFVSGSSTASTPTMVVREGVVSPTGGVGAFDVQNSAGTTLFFVSGSGRVGIASASPNARLEINLGGSNAEILTLKTTYAADSSYHSMTWRDGSNITGQIDTRYDGTTVDMVFGSLYSSGYNSTERMRIKGNGDVGIGTSTYTARLFVSGSSTASTPTMIVREGVVSPTGGAGVFSVQNSAGTSLLFVSGSGYVGVGITNPTTYKLDVVGQIKSRNLAAGDTTGITLGNNGSERARIQFTASDDSARFKIEVNSVNASSERLSFYAGPLGGVATNEAMIIGGNGNVGIGTGTLATSRLLVTGSGATSSTSTMHLVNSSNSSLFFVRDDGNVGIGSSSPGYNLQVGSGASVGTRTLALIDSGYGIVIKGGNGNGIVQSLGTTVPLEFQAGNGNNGNYVFSSTGNVGIGTATPTSKLHIYTTQNDATATPSVDVNAAFIRIGDPTTGLSFNNGLGIKLHDGGTVHYSIGQLSGSFVISQTSDNGNVLFSSGRTDGIVMNSSGFVGLGTTLMDSRLVVAGTSVFSGSANPDGDLTRDLGTSSKRWRNLYAGNISGSLTGSNVSAGQVVVAGTGGVLSGSNNFWWDNTNRAVGIGTASPTAKLHSVSADGTYQFAVSGTSKAVRFLTNSSAAYIEGVDPTLSVSYQPLVLGGSTVTLSNSGTSVLIVDTSSNVGIGAASDGTKLYVRYDNASSYTSTGFNTSTLHLRNGSGASDSTTMMTFSSAWSGAGWYLGLVEANTSYQANLVFQARTGASTTAERMRINTSGDVGIGTTSYTARLFVSGSSTASTPTMLVKEGVVSPTGGARTFEVQKSTGTAILSVSGSGFVGIGTTNPAGNLEVVGVSGSLLLVTDSLSGSLFSVNDVTGLPILEVFSDDTVIAGTVNSNALVVTGSLVGVGVRNPSARLFVSGTSVANQPEVVIREGVAAPTGGVGILDVQNSAGTSLLFVSGSGRIGVGTTPSATISNAKLEVNGSVVPTTHLGSGNNLGESTNYWGTLYTSAGYIYNGGTNSVAAVGNTFQVYTQSSPAAYSIYADANNRVGIGAASLSTARLIVSGTSTTTDTTLLVKHGVANGSALAVINAQNSAGTSLLFLSGSGAVGIGTSTLVASGLTISDVANINNAARLNLRQDNSDVGNRLASVSFNSNAVSIYTAAESTGVANNTLAYFHYNYSIFYTGTTATNPSERLRIDSSGNVGIGTTNPNGNRLAISGGNLSVTGSALPGVDNTYDLGSTSKRWKTIYAATGSISNVVFSPVSTGATYSTTFASGESGRLTATKTIAAATNTTFFTVSANNGASMFDVAFVVSESGFSVARKYSVAAQYGTSSSNVVTFKTVDTGPYSGYDLTVTFTKSSGTVTTCTVSHNYTTSTNIAMTIDVSAISSGGAPTTVTIF